MIIIDEREGDVAGPISIASDNPAVIIDEDDRAISEGPRLVQAEITSIQRGTLVMVTGISEIASSSAFAWSFVRARSHVFICSSATKLFL